MRLATPAASRNPFQRQSSGDFPPTERARSLEPVLYPTNFESHFAFGEFCQYDSKTPHCSVALGQALLSAKRSYT
jgi:hypothetical protein